MFICAFFAQLGMQGKLIALLLPALLINYLAISRIICETGLRLRPWTGGVR